MPKLSNQDSYLKVRIISPRQILFQDLALSVSSKNSAGKFDILPQHANFITLIQGNPVIVRKADRENVTFNFPIAIIQNKDNQVNIYTNITLPALPQ